MGNNGLVTPLHPVATAKQLVSQVIILNGACKGCGTPNAQIARTNHELVPSRVLGVQNGQAKVQGNATPVDAFAMCLACGRRARLLPVNGVWQEAETPAEGTSADAPATEP